MRAVVVTTLVLVPLTLLVGLVHGQRSEQFVLMCSASALVLGWLLVRLAFERYDR